MATIGVELSKVVSNAEWLNARKAFLAKEKEFTRRRDELSRLRRELPRVKVEKEYVFDTPDGKKTLAQLFDGRSQLVVYHFMFGPGWKEGCPGCSFFADHMDGANLHLAHHDVTLLAVSRGTLAELEAFKKRMGWRFNWVSSHGNDFNYDYDVSFTEDGLAKGGILYNYEMNEETRYHNEELPGLSVFYKDEAGDIFHTYSTYARGLDVLLGTYHYLELTPLGRNESGANNDFTNWVRHHDKYEGVQEPRCCG